MGPKLGIGAAHALDHHRRELVEERRLDPELLPVAHGAAHDLAQDVTPALVARDDAVADQERHRPQVVRDDAQRDVALRGPGP